MTIEEENIIVTYFRRYFVSSGKSKNTALEGNKSKDGDFSKEPRFCYQSPKNHPETPTSNNNKTNKIY